MAKKRGARSKSRTIPPERTAERPPVKRTEFLGRTFDVAPDPIDLRDFPYRPRLRSLPSQYPAPSVTETYLPKYQSAVDDQGQEGACTGFGLAAVVNFLLWTQYWREAAIVAADRGGKLPAVPRPKQFVSPRMLYEMARHYDEWPGEDYEGSSCRGAMKGWQKHGVCNREMWPYSVEVFVPPKDGWQEDARQVRLGAYYRVDKSSVNDLQAALFEIGALYVSADVHDGWELWDCKSLEEALIPPPKKKDRGGHAFAMVGYNDVGFIVQNSWGPDWGFHGFALLPYDDWQQHASDAWAAALGVPIRSFAEMTAGRTPGVVPTAAGRESERMWTRQVAWRKQLAREGLSAARVQAATQATTPWNELTAYDHTVVQGDDGRPLRRQPVSPTAQAAVKRTCVDLPHSFFQASGTAPRVVFYAHGGLNNEAASLNRIRVLGPYFKHNGVFPIFYTWRTGFRESAEKLMRGQVDEWVNQVWGTRPSEFGLPGVRDWLRKVQDEATERWDRAIEAGSRLAIKPIWAQMQQSAEDGAEPNCALNETVAQLKQLQALHPKLEVHLVAHSAGSIVLGHLFPHLKRQGLAVKTCTLWAPACTVAFAQQHYVPAIADGTLAKDRLFLDVLNDERERADSVGPYNKSLLYLVSQSLERERKSPLLGMQCAWVRPVPRRTPWSEAGDDVVKAWLKYWGDVDSSQIHIHETPTVSNGPEKIPLAHGSFDNDVAVVTEALLRIRGTKELDHAVTNLKGF